MLPPVETLRTIVSRFGIKSVIGDEIMLLLVDIEVCCFSSSSSTQLFQNRSSLKNRWPLTSQTKTKVDHLKLVGKNM
jgi:hypothetical protein